MRNMKLILVEWLDTVDNGAEWTHPEMPDPRPVRVKTVGYLKADNKTHVVVVRDFYDQDKRRVCGGVIAIPKGMIVKITPLAPVRA